MFENTTNRQTPHEDSNLINRKNIIVPKQDEIIQIQQKTTPIPQNFKNVNILFTKFMTTKFPPDIYSTPNLKKITSVHSKLDNCT